MSGWQGARRQRQLCVDRDVVDRRRHSSDALWLRRAVRRTSFWRCAVSLRQRLARLQEREECDMTTNKCECRDIYTVRSKASLAARARARGCSSFVSAFVSAQRHRLRRSVRRLSCASAARHLHRVTSALCVASLSSDEVHQCARSPLPTDCTCASTLVEMNGACVPKAEFRPTTTAPAATDFFANIGSVSAKVFSLIIRQKLTRSIRTNSISSDKVVIIVGAVVGGVICLLVRFVDFVAPHACAHRSTQILIGVLVCVCCVCMTRRQTDQTSTGRSMNDVAREGNPLYLGFVFESVSIVVVFVKGQFSILVATEQKQRFGAPAELSDVGLRVERQRHHSV